MTPTTTFVEPAAKGVDRPVRIAIHPPEAAAGVGAVIADGLDADGPVFFGEGDLGALLEDIDRPLRLRAGCERDAQKNPAVAIGSSLRPQ
jgi:hypothetical protein